MRAGQQGQLFYRVAQKSKPPSIFSKNRIKDC